MMKERPILFSGPMVRAILDGTKTQTRRVCKLQADDVDPEPDYQKHKWAFWKQGDPVMDLGAIRVCPYGQPGARLWVRETFRTIRRGTHLTDGFDVQYLADYPTKMGAKWKPSIHMPRWACRLLLEVKAVRVDRLQDISEDDAKAEGVERSRLLPKDCNPFRTKLHGHLPELQEGTRRGAFACFWNLLNEKRGHGWESNPWVWVIEFERVTDEP